jgi:hypothetical protein
MSSQTLRLLDQRPSFVNFDEKVLGAPTVGLSFDCPHCNRRLMVYFAVPIERGPEWMGGLRQTGFTYEQMVFSHFGKQSLYQRTGDNFDALTLTPSVDIRGHWHGHITNGVLTFDASSPPRKDAR